MPPIDEGAGAAVAGGPAESSSSEAPSPAKRLRLDAGETLTSHYSKITTEYATSPMNAVSAHIESEVPERTKTEDCWMGIDEAGRGPVCGPMTYGICYGPIAGEKKLKGMGFMDSKQLTEEVRERLFKEIKEASDFIGWSVAVLSPQDISGHMLGRINYNLNAMSHDCAISMVKRVLEQGVQLTELYVDTVGKEDFYQEKLERIFPQLQITVTSKADVKFPIVSAASICAKVGRLHWHIPGSSAPLCLFCELTRVVPLPDPPGHSRQRARSVGVCRTRRLPEDPRIRVSG